ncbi:MAG: hypothetical protein AAB416_03655 [Patescibacteria group bacterium]
MTCITYHVSRITYLCTGVVIAVSTFFFGSQYVHAAALTDLMIRVSTPIVESFSDYTIMFRSASGMASGSISLNLTNASMNLTALTRDDLDLMFGATQATIATTAGAGVWGAVIDTSARTITFSYPTTGGTPIPAGSMVVIRIGAHATFQAQGLGRPVNQNVSGQKSLAITAGSDSGNASVTLQTTIPQNRQMINGDVGPNRVMVVGAEQDSGALAVAIVTNDRVGVTANRIQSTSMSGGIFAPSELRSIATKEGVIEMTWRDNSGIERGFIVERREVKEGREESYEAIALLDQNSTSYRDTNLPPERQFQYRVRSYNDLTFSTYTTSGAIMTIKLAVPSAPLGGFIPGLKPVIRKIVVPAETSTTDEQTTSKSTVIESPTNVLNLEAKGDDGRATLTWGNPPDPTVLYVQIQWSEKGFPQDINEGVTVYKEFGTSFSDMNLPNDIPAYYTVFAVNKYGKQSSGAAVTVTPKGPPPLVLPPVIEKPAASSAIGQEQRADQPLASVATPSGEITAPPTAPVVQAVTLTLAPEASKTFLPQQEATLEAKNSGSSGETSGLTLSIPSQTLPTPFEVSVAPITYEQVRDIDSGVALPKDTAVLGDTFYKISIQRDDQETHRFSKDITLQFKYSKKLVSGIVETSLRVHSWDALMNEWIALPSKVDTENNTVEGTTKHASLFSVFGQRSDEQKHLNLKVISKTKITKQKGPPLRATSVFDLSSFITVNGRELVAQAGTALQMCVSATLFSRPVRFMTMTFDTSRYFLMYDFTRKCYAGNLLMPTAIGSYPLNVKVVFADDRVQQDKFTVRTIATKDRPLPPITQIVPQETVDRLPLHLIGYGIIAVIALLINVSIVYKLIKGFRD